MTDRDAQAIDGSGSAGDIDFWFDFASAYAYFAALEIDDLGRRVRRRINWHPFALGAAFKATGSRGLSSTPLKRDYARTDWHRIARLRGVPFRLPDHHPSVALAATRVFYLVAARDPERAPAFAREIFSAYYTRGIDSGNLDHVLAVAASLGLPADEFAAEATTPAIKDRVKRVSERALELGIFGSPYFVVDGEPFWGWDRMPMMERWIETGGW
ncbi:DSBA oxidoreductase [uncultured Alphaproteobacteria bacterium]|uniref:2-hydroxychromene-2-carboxylate isomerase n=1 Tax=uncultured Alphaproteobacteria bacterium TaxID=91750 RepID=A0A212JZV1_9PROT|nr:DSBA oxidoreductase [uncultured Alphaproteobacteria bacterium]